MLEISVSDAVFLLSDKFWKSMMLTESYKIKHALNWNLVKFIHESFLLFILVELLQP